METSQNIESFSFQVEDNISPPKKLFDKITLDEISQKYSNKIYASSFKNNGNKRLVYFGEHTIFEGFYQAYVNHCPIVLSPDVFWTLIVQGFTRHVLVNAEKLRDKFVSFEDKKELWVNNIIYPRIEDIPQEKWEEDIKTYIEKISNFVGQDFIDTIKPDFSTTTEIISQVGQISIMTCMKKYFTFMNAYGGCGYPRITLEGKVEDYIKIKEKANKLRKYDLDFWIDEINPILDKIIETRKGNVDKEFWKKFYYNVNGSIISSDPNKPIKVRKIRGWICKFIPYDSQERRRYDLEELPFKRPFYTLPKDILSVPINMYHVITGKITELNCRAGFIGMEQDEKTYEMKPFFGWYVSDDVKGSEYKLQRFDKYDYDEYL
jgi:hypothetical protein